MLTKNWYCVSCDFVVAILEVVVILIEKNIYFNNLFNAKEYLSQIRSNQPYAKECNMMPMY